VIPPSNGGMVNCPTESNGITLWKGSWTLPKALLGKSWMCVGMFLRGIGK